MRWSFYITALLIASVALYSLYTRQPRTSERDLPPRPVLDAAIIELEIFRYSNELRRRAGVPPLQLDPHLRRVARRHSSYMASAGLLTHFGAQGQRATERVFAACGGNRECRRRFASKAAGTAGTGDEPRVACCGENVIESLPHNGSGAPFYYDSDDEGRFRVWQMELRWFDAIGLARNLVDRFYESPGHRRILLHPQYQRFGMAVRWSGRRYYATQLFAPGL